MLKWRNSTFNEEENNSAESKESNEVENSDQGTDTQDEQNLSNSSLRTTGPMARSRSQALMNSLKERSTSLTLMLTV